MLLRLRRMALSVAIRDRDAETLARRRDEARRLAPPETGSRGVPQESFGDRLARQLAERRAADPPKPPEPAKPLTVSEILQQQRDGTWVDPDQPKGPRPPTPGYRGPRL